MSNKRFKFIELIGEGNLPIDDNVPYIRIGNVIAIPDTVDYVLTTQKRLNQTEADQTNLNMKTPQI